MNWGIFFTFLLIQTALLGVLGPVLPAGALLAAANADGVCVKNANAPGLTAIRCLFPNCPTGADCLAPTIDKTNVEIQYQEPLLKWMDPCPSKEFPSASCWEAYLELTLHVAAEDPSTVSHVGANLAVEVSNKRLFRKIWGRAQKKDSAGRFEINHTIAVHIPAGQSLDLSVFEVCARDAKNNEACFVPSQREGNQIAPGAKREATPRQ